METDNKEMTGIKLRPRVRTLKIQPKTIVNVFNSKHVPEIKLCGNWLEELGFHHGKRVCITSMNGLLIIRLQTDKDPISDR